MRIKKLEMKNFRGFEELTVQFPEKGSAVFVGVNGAGKTSVLECILSQIKRISTSKNSRLGSTLVATDIRIGTFLSNVKLSLEFDGNIYILKGDYKKKIETKSEEWRNIESAYIDLSERIRAKMSSNSLANIPLFSFYPTNRIVENDPSLKIKDLSRENQLDALSDAFREIIDFNDFFEWFRNTEDLENEIRLQENPNHRNRGLEMVRNAIKIFLPNISNFRIKRKGVLEFIIEKENKVLVFGNLSHGEKAMFAMIGDIARRLSIANPSLANPLEGEGVILIDEIELHLHPKWQRTIVPRLEKTFPNIQFILTTHSPQVLSSMKRENVFILENFKLVQNTPHTFGKDSNSILYDLFGVSERPDEVKKEFKKLYRLIDDVSKVEEAKEEYKRMKNKYGEFDAEIVRAGIHFDFLTK